MPRRSSRRVCPLEEAIEELRAIHALAEIHTCRGAACTHPCEFQGMTEEQRREALKKDFDETVALLRARARGRVEH